MNNPPNSPINLNPEEGKSPLQLWVAYVPGEGDKKNYLSNGKQGKDKGIRLFKSERAAWDHLKELFETGKMTEWAYLNVVVHSIDGKIAMPDEVQEPHAIPIRLPLKNQPTHLNPIITLAKEDIPTSLELVQQYERQKPRRKRH
jgi:hypothetical protein